MRTEKNQKSFKKNKIKPDNFSQEDEIKGRITEHTDEDYKIYWNMNDGEKQEFLRESYEKRNAKDIYATSRDFNIRELEIASIKKNIDHKGRVLDLGCGNGYTLLSLAKYFENWEMTGIDFSNNLIAGAKYLLDKSKNELKSIPDFICTNAIDYIESLQDNSIRYVVTERFIQNLPSIDIQKKIIKEIHRILIPKGKLLMCEGSSDGFNALNDLRESVGLSRIAETSSDNISAIRIKDKDFEIFLETELNLKLKSKNGFSFFFIMARVLHPLLVSPQKPKFDAEINRYAKLIQDNLPNDAKYSGNILWVFEK